MMGRKARFVEQFFRGDPELRTMEDLGEAGMYEQASAMSTTDERIITLTEMKQDLMRAQRRQAAHDSEQYALRTQLRAKEEQATDAAERISAMQENIARREDTRGDAFKMQVGGESFDKRADAAKALDAEIETRGKDMRKGGDSETIGRIGGFPITMRLSWMNGNPVLDMRLTNGRMLELFSAEGGGKGYIASAEATLRKFEEYLANRESDRAAALRAAAAIRPLIGKQFTGGEEIQRLSRAVRDLEETLKAEAAAKEKGDAPPPDAPATASQGTRVHTAIPETQPDPEMQEAEQQLAQMGATLTDQDRAEIAAADQGVQLAEQRAAAIDEAGACLKGGE